MLRFGRGSESKNFSVRRKMAFSRLLGRPEDLANAIVFLASDQASWITGQRIKVDGGCGFNLK